MTDTTGREDRAAAQRARIRDHLTAILDLWGRCAEAAESASYAGEHHDGPPLGGEAMVHLAPAAPFALNDDTDPVPAVELAWWEYAARSELGHQPTGTPTLTGAAVYLRDHLHDFHRLDLDKLEKRAESIRYRLEDELRAGLRNHYGVPCLTCRRLLIRRMQPRTGLADYWECLHCQRRLTVAEYWRAVRADYLKHATALPADLLGLKYDIRPNLIRVWGARGKIRKHGKSVTGTTLYDVADVEALLDQESKRARTGE